MKKRIHSILLFWGAVFLLVSCSTQKNTKASRFYHAFTTRYNIYYNGKVAFDQSLESMQQNYKESYSDRILMYPISAQPKEKAEPGGSFDRAIEKSNKAIKLHSIQVKPEKKPGWRNNPKMVALQSQEEYNPFLKNSWLMLGQAQFYNADFLQAAATFSYISRHYAHDEEIVAEARIWQARCYSEMGWAFEAEDILKKLNTNGIHPKKRKQYAAVNADYLIKEQRFEEAIPYLQIAIKGEKNRRQRTRMKYLLGQIYTDLEMNTQAYSMFGEVIRANPPYELEFAARIRQTEVFSGGNYQKMVKMLERMGKKEKNKNFLDQVYYAIGNIYLSKQDTLQAIDNYELAVEKSTQNGMDKAMAQIKVGDLYFSMGNYIKAQPHFSGALAGIKKEYKDYERVAKLSSVLDELVIHAEAVHLQDSLQTLARMPEEERNAAIDKVIEQVIKEEKEQKEQTDKEAYLTEQAGKGTGMEQRPGTETGGIVLPTANDGSFYFYNTQTVAQGKTQFQRQWGRRALEDDWRRLKKTLSTFEENEAEVDPEAVAIETAEDGSPIPSENGQPTPPVELSNDPKTREYYIQQLPLTPEDIDASNVIIIDGLFHMAMIYKDKLGDLNLSIQAFEELESRFPGNIHLLESYYQIFLMALRLGEISLSEQYKSKLNASFPESDYAVAVADPNYEYNIRMMDVVQDSIYQETYNSYLNQEISQVRNNYQEISERYPLAKLMPKFMFLDALTYVQEGDVEGFKETLKALLDKFPSADVSELAGEMLKGVLRGRELVSGSVRGMTWNLRFGVGENGLSDADRERTFTTEKNTPHRMMLVFPTGSMDKNQLLFAIASYNFANFLVKEVDLSFEESESVTMLMITGFYNFDEIVQYYHMIYEPKGYGSVLNNEISVFPISEENYQTLIHGKTLDEYVAFFEESYGEEEPDMIARWHIRQDDDKRQMEEEKAKTSEIEEKTDITEESSMEVEAEIEATTTDIPTEPDNEDFPEEKIEEAKEEINEENPIIEEEEEKTEDTVAPAEENLGLTLKEIEEIRQREIEEKAILEEEKRLAKEEELRAEQERKAEEAREKEALIQKQKEEEAFLLKKKEEQEKQRQVEKKIKQKEAEKERKNKLKEREQLRKQKEKENKQRLKQREKERKEKERKQKALRKAKEAEAKAKKR